MEDRGSGYCSSPAALISVRNMFLQFFPHFPRFVWALCCVQQPSPFLPPQALLLAAVPSSSSKLTPPVGLGPGKRVPQGFGSPLAWDGMGMLREKL